MTTTTAAYLSVTQNLPRYQKMTSADPAVKLASEYYAANIGKVSSISDLVGNYRLLSYALSAYGLSDHINDKALVTKVLEGGVSSSTALANKLTDPRWKAFAKAFDFAGSGASSVTSNSAVATTKQAYVENQLEIDQGSQDVGVQLALYFRRVAPTITNSYGVLGDKNILQVVQTIFKLPPVTGSTNIDRQAALIEKVMPVADLQDPAKLEKLTERFTAMYDMTYGPNSGATSSLTVSGYGSTQANAASTILQGIVTSNGQMIASALASGGPTTLFSNQMLTQMQNLTLGGR